MDLGLVRAGFPNCREIWRTRARRGGRRSGRGDRLLGCESRGFIGGEPALQQGDGGLEVVVELSQEIDVVEILFAAEAVG